MKIQIVFGVGKFSYPMVAVVLVLLTELAVKFGEAADVDIKLQPSGATFVTLEIGPKSAQDVQLVSELSELYREDGAAVVAIYHN